MILLIFTLLEKNNSTDCSIDVSKFSNIELFRRIGVRGEKT